MQSRVYSSAIALGLLGWLAGCGPSSAGDAAAGGERLAGEWRLSISRSAQGENATELRPVGTIVFHESIPCYCDASAQLNGRDIVGRAYITAASVLPELAGPQYEEFGAGKHADMKEEAIARLDSTGTVIVETGGTPQLRFRGTFSNGHGTIRGSWAYVDDAEAYLGRADTVAAGEFSMTRRTPTVYSDSAKLRAQRSVEEWKKTPPAIPPGGTDTVAPIAPPTRRR